MQKIKILGIAPYQNLKNIMMTAAASWNQVELTVYVGNLEAGAELVRQHIHENYDVIISRGGTARMIQKLAQIPVIEIPISIHDILHAMVLLENSTVPYAVVGYPDFTDAANLLCQMMNYHMNIITIQKTEEIQTVLNQLKAKNCELILCDVITETLARKAGLKPILILSGTESVETAIRQAVEICNSTYAFKQKYTLLDEALQTHDTDTIILNSNGDVLYSTYNQANILEVLSYLRQLITDTREPSPKAFHLIDQKLFSLFIKKATINEVDCFIFCVKQNPVPIGGSKHGLRFSTYTDVSVSYTNSFYALTASAKLIDEKISLINQSSTPVMILGERGSGKNQVASKLYLSSSWNKYPYITIDCQMLNDRMWSFITGHYNSPLNDKNNTIFISNLQALSRQRQEQLLSYLIDTYTFSRNRLIFSCSQTLDLDTPDPSRNYIDYLTCATIYLPPLRELTEDIQLSSKLYLNALNIEMSKQILGFTPKAMELLCSYHWPDNFMQLKRVLAELVMLTSDSYIQEETVSQVLEKERRQYVPTTSAAFNYNRPLDEMIHDIAKIVLAQSGGNQTTAAKRLGIGRTTLWRYLNKKSE